MLSARKLHLLAGLKVDQTDLRTRELDFYMARYIAIASVSSIMTCLAYVGLIKIKIPEYKNVGSEMMPGGSWEVMSFYVFDGLTIALAMFNLFLTSFMVVNAQGLSLRGPPGSVATCVEICKENWLIVRATLVASLVSMFLSAMSIVWMKHDWQNCEEMEPGSGGEPERSSGGEEHHHKLVEHLGAPVLAGEEPESEEMAVLCSGLSLHVISALLATAVFISIFGVMVRHLMQIAQALSIRNVDLVAGDLTISTAQNGRLDIVAEGQESIPRAR